MSEEVILEKLKNVSREMEHNFQETKKALGVIKEQNRGLDANQKLTNGNVKNLQLWRAAILGGFSVITLFMGIITFLLNSVNQRITENTLVNIQQDKDNAVFQSTVPSLINESINSFAEKNFNKFNK